MRIGKGIKILVGWIYLDWTPQQISSLLPDKKSGWFNSCILDAYDWLFERNKFGFKTEMSKRRGR